ncbi:MAG: hypothetical protein RBR71_12095 [Gudongella sp.]|nr:hypothetical protein [Gudongella sp.]
MQKKVEPKMQQTKEEQKVAKQQNKIDKAAAKNRQRVAKADQASARANIQKQKGYMHGMTVGFWDRVKKD